LIGIPHRVVFSDKGLDEGRCEYKARRADAVEMIAIENLVEHLERRRR
jgi:prolyl-tRNA synthetase